MAETALSLATVVTRRVRDPLFTAHAIEDVYDILSWCQRVVNAHVNGARNQTMTVPTVPTSPFVSAMALSGFDINEIRVGKTTAVAQANRPLRRIDWRSLVRMDTHWLNQREAHPRFWGYIGQDEVFLWPQYTTALTIAVSTLNIAHIDFFTDGDVTALPDTHMPALLAMAESILLLRQRLFASLPQAIQRAVEKGSAGRAL